MRIVVISDTHIPKRAKSFPAELIVELEKADLIIHAGDWQTVEVYDELLRFAKVEGVIGNVDNEELKKLIEDKIVLNIKGFKLGVTHGHGTGKTTEKRVIEAFSGQDLDCIIFGHSHIPVKKYLDNDTLLFNPGSPTDKRRQKKYSFGIITIDEEALKAEHIFFDKDKQYIIDKWK